MSRGSRFGAWLLLAALATASLAVATERHPATYLVLEFDAGGRPVPVFVRDVELASEPRTMTEREFGEAGVRRGSEGVVALLRGADGGIFHRTIAPLERWIRGEFAGEMTDAGERIEGTRVLSGAPAIVLRLPRRSGARLELPGPPEVAFDLDELRGRAASLRLGSADLASPSVLAEPSAGDPANRVDLLVMSEGYTAGQQALFVGNAATLVTAILGVTPYAEYSTFLNVVDLFVASPQAGADHPPYLATCSTNDPSCCADPAALGDPLAGTYVDTAFDARFCAYNIHRLLVVDTSAVLAAASAVPDWDRILVVVNDTVYGGSGGYVGVLSMHPSAPWIGIHEYGHSFTDLADEYDSPYPGYPPCSDVTGPACEANATDRTTLATLKWASWVPPGTPIPTPENAGYGGVVGLFEGARYLATGMYRPRESACVMQFLGAPFCEICRQEYVLQLYRGGWGEPAGGIDSIEPGTESPAPGQVTVAATGRTFAAAVLDPASGPAQQATWRVDGVLQSTGGRRWFFFDPAGGGPYSIELRVEDPTSFVQSSMAAGLLRSTRTWTVAVGANVVFVDGFESGDGVAWSALVP